MQNVSFNPGGLIGALLGGGGLALIVFLSVADPNNAGRLIGRSVVFGIVGGAFAGNVAWDFFFREKPRKAAKTSPLAKPKARPKKLKPLDDE